MPQRRPLLAVLALMGLVALCWGAIDLWPRRMPWATGPAALDPRARPHKVWRGTYAGSWWLRHARARWHRPAQPARILVLGDSIVHGWDRAGAASWAHHLASRGAANLGFAGDRTQHLLWRIEHGELRRRDPDVVVLAIGSNNLVTDPADHVVAAHVVLLQQVRDALPEAALVVQAILPRGADPTDPIRARIATANSGLAALAARAGAVWVDPGDCFVDEAGAIPPSRMPDGIHPSAAGYACQAAALEPTLAATTQTPQRPPLPEAAWSPRRAPAPR